MPIIYATTDTQLEHLIRRTEALVVYFTASWCGPCQAIAPVVEKLYDTYHNLEVYKVDIDSCKPAAAKHNITAVPTFVFFHKGKEVSRLRGANVQGIYEGFNKLSLLAPGATRDAAVHKTEANKTEEQKQVQRYIHPGYSILNQNVYFAEFEALDCLTLDKENKEIQNVVREVPQRLGKTAIVSDADSQLILHIPLTNICKIYSILIKFRDGEYDGAELQRPYTLKMWANRSSIIGFDDAVNLDAPMDGYLNDDAWDENGWLECKPMFVRFQKVTSLDLFFDGFDEEVHTCIDRILIVGVDGDAKSQGKLEKLGE